MELLPYDVLVMVMQYVTRHDLFTCRLVCKRLGAVAVHPDAWRGRRHFYCDSTAFRLCPVLRIAPCLNDLEIYALSEKMLQCCQLMLATTRCAVRSVGVSLSGSERGVVRLAALVLRRQEALGRLRAVTIRLDEKGGNGDEASVLLATVASMPGLTRLVVAGITASKPNLLSHHFTSASLEYFECELRPESASFCAFMLAAHANALREVDLAGHRMQWICSSLTSLAPLLAGLPKLRKLRSRMLPGLEAVADSKSLRELTLVVRPADQPGAPAAAALLARAKQLRAVTLDYTPAACVLADVGVSLVLALAASGQSAVESLTIWNGCRYNLPQAQPLLTALPFFSALRHLELGVTSEELLQAISPASAPALQTLALSRPNWVFWERQQVNWHNKSDRFSACLGHVFCSHFACAHSWLHIDTVDTLLFANPSLQVLVPGKNGFYCYVGDCCSACELGCHPKLRDFKAVRDRDLETRPRMLLPRNIPQ